MNRQGNKQITVKFKPCFREPLLSGRKTLTARTKRLGKAGDRFVVFDGCFELISVTDVPLYEVKRQWKAEGCDSETHFVDIWRQLHPVVGYSDHQRVYLHEFRLLTPQDGHL